MCLGAPGCVVSIEGQVALVDFWGVTRPVRLEVADAPVAPGAHVLDHVGFDVREADGELLPRAC